MARVKVATIAKKQRQIQALKLRKEGWTYEAIAEELGVSDKTVHGYVNDALDELDFLRTFEAMEVRQMVLDRNQDAIRAIYEQVHAGNLNAIDRLVRINEQLLNIVTNKTQNIDLTSGGKPIPLPISIVEVVLTDTKEVEPNDTISIDSTTED